MSAWLIAAVGVVYACIACEQFYLGHPWMGVVFTGYSLSNVGLFKMAQLAGVAH